MVYLFLSNFDVILHIFIVENSQKNNLAVWSHYFEIDQIR